MTGLAVNFLIKNYLMHGSIWPVNIPPGNPQDKYSPLGQRLRNCLMCSCPGGRRRCKSKVISLWFFEVCVTSLAVCMKLQNSRLRIFKGKCRNLLESGWRGMTIKIKVCIWRNALKFHLRNVHGICKGVWQSGTWSSTNPQRHITDMWKHSFGLGMCGNLQYTV